MRDSVNEILSLVKNNKFEEFEEELKNGIPINITNNRGRNALFYAKTPEQFEFLISKNIDVNATDNQGLDIINYIFRNNSKFDIDKKEIFINLLFPYFTNMRAFSNNNDSEITIDRDKTIISYLNPYNLSKLYNSSPKLEVFKMIKKELYYSYGSPLFLSDIDKKSFLLSIGQNIKSINSFCENALFYAKDIKEIDLLLKAGIDPDIINNLGCNFLFKIITSSEYKNDKDINSVKEIINFLECNYPNINILENKINPPAFRINSEIAFILLESVSFLKYGNEKLKEILLKSISNNNKTFVKLLQKDFDFNINIHLPHSDEKINFYKYLLINNKEVNFCELIEKNPEYMDSKEKWLELFKRIHNLNIKNVKKVLSIAGENDIDFRILSEKEKKDFFRNFLYGKEKILELLISHDKINNLSFEDFSKFVKNTDNYFNINEKNLNLLHRAGLDLNDESVISQISDNPKAIFVLKKLKAEKEKQEIINSLDISKSKNLTKRRI